MRRGVVQRARVDKDEGQDKDEDRRVAMAMMMEVVNEWEVVMIILRPLRLVPCRAASRFLVGARNPQQRPCPYKIPARQQEISTRSREQQSTVGMKDHQVHVSIVRVDHDGLADSKTIHRSIKGASHDGIIVWIFNTKYIRYKRK